MSEFIGDQLYRIGKVSQRLGVSIPTVKNWIYSGKISTLRTVENSKNMRRRLNRWNFKQFQQYLEYKATSTGHLVEYETPRNTSKKCLKCGELTPCKTQTFVCKHCGFTINHQVQAPINIVENYLNKRLKMSNKNKNVASPVPAERQLMKTMVGELREFKEHIVRDASQYDKRYHSISILSV